MKQTLFKRRLTLCWNTLYASMNERSRHWFLDIRVQCPMLNDCWFSCDLSSDLPVTSPAACCVSLLSYSEKCQQHAGTLTSVRGTQVPWLVTAVCRYPDRCQRFAGAQTSVRCMRLPWPCQRYAGILTNVRCMQTLIYWVFNSGFLRVHH